VEVPQGEEGREELQGVAAALVEQGREAARAEEQAAAAELVREVRKGSGQTGVGGRQFDHR